MVFLSTLLAVLFGFPVGILLTITEKGHLKENRWLHRTVGSDCQYRPFFSFCHLDSGAHSIDTLDCRTSLGTTAAIIPLSIAAIPFMARLVEASLKEVDKGMMKQPSSWDPQQSKLSLKCCCRNLFLH